MKKGLIGPPFYDIIQEGIVRSNGFFGGSVGFCIDQVNSSSYCPYFQEVFYDKITDREHLDCDVVYGGVLGLCNGRFYRRSSKPCA